jgi:hypothetical protein
MNVASACSPAPLKGTGHPVTRERSEQWQLILIGCVEEGCVLVYLGCSLLSSLPKYRGPTCFLHPRGPRQEKPLCSQGLAEGPGRGQWGVSLTSVQTDGVSRLSALQGCVHCGGLRTLGFTAGWWELGLLWFLLVGWPNCRPRILRSPAPAAVVEAREVPTSGKHLI